MKIGFTLGVLFYLMGFSSLAYAQYITEPQYIGQVKMILEDGQTITISQEPCSEVQKGSLYALNSSIGLSSSSNYIYLPDRQEFPVMSMDEDVRLIVRVPNMDYTPESLIEVYQIKNNLFGRYLDGRIQYTAERYGESSYLIQLPCSEEGEIAVLVAGCKNVASTIRVEYNEQFYAKKIRQILDYLQLYKIELKRRGIQSEIYDINKGYYITQKMFVDLYGSRMYYKLTNAYETEMRRQRQEKQNMEEIQRLEQKRIQKEARKAAKKSK